MIGVLSKTKHWPAVEEFFELFKTPWEHYEPGRAYDVVIANVDALPQVCAKLLILYGAGKKDYEPCSNISFDSRTAGGSLHYRGGMLPIYGDLATFGAGEHAVPYVAASSGIAVLRVAGDAGPTMIRVGYDLFEEVQLLLSSGQPAGHALMPTLDLHVALLRKWILNEGIPLLEVPPTPANRTFTVCLTHDIDFLGIREHKFDHTMWGFLYRSTIGAVRNLVRRRISVKRLFDTWRAALTLPCVYLGWAKDFWSPFEWYLGVEENLPATYFLIPFKHSQGQRVPGRNAARRASSYDAGDIRSWITFLQEKDCEVGVHGIDAWHSAEKGRAELSRIAEITGRPHPGVRIHWLLCNASTPLLLDQSGFAYDSTAGYNETVGYRNGTTQAFRPLGAKTLLELPLHIQDGALFFHDRLDLSDTDAEKLCQILISNAQELGGVLTLLWHDRSHAPERFWGDFYIDLISTLKAVRPWFATAKDVVGWFRKRRDVTFERTEVPGSVRAFRGAARQGSETEKDLPPLCLRMHWPAEKKNASSFEDMSTYTDVPWDGITEIEFNLVNREVSEQPLRPPVLENCL